MSKLWSIRLTLVAIFALLGVAFAANAVSAQKSAPLYGHCHRCSCPGFTGAGYTCTRGGCSHHYDLHY